MKSRRGRDSAGVGTLVRGILAFAVEALVVGLLAVLAVAIAAVFLSTG